MRRWIAGVGTVLCLAGGGVAATAQAQTAGACPAGATCASVVVPLDRSGVVPGTVSVAYARYAATGARRGTIVVLSGGPGQAALPLAPEIKLLLHPLEASYDIVLVDQRGTGASGALTCAAAPKGVFGASTTAADVTRCADSLGAARAFYSTYDTAQDIDAVRAALGVDQIIPLGVSYGGQLAGEYARRFPSRVQALVLDSSSPIEGVDALGRLPGLALSRVLREVCFPAACVGPDADPAAALARLVAALQRHPEAGSLILPSGHRTSAPLTARGLYALISASDESPILRSEIPAAIGAALAHDPAPLVRLLATAGAGGSAAGDEDDVRFLATACTEAKLPWTADSAPAGRPALLAGALSATPDAWAPFGAGTVAPLLTATRCLPWPATPTPSQSGGEGPDVPVLVLAGREDLRTPLESQRRTAAQYPNATVLAVPDTGHSVLTTDLTGCALTGLVAFLNAAPVQRCVQRTRIPAVAPAFVRSLAALPTLPHVSAAAGRGLLAVKATLLDAARQTTLAAGATTAKLRVGGLRGGTLTATKRTLKLTGYELIDGVRVSGDLPGTLTLRAPGATGTLHASASGSLRGTIDGVAVHLAAMH